MTPAELLQFTYVRYKLSVLSLMLMMSLFLFYNVFHHTVSLVALIYALVYIVVLNVGMRGASTRSVRMLRFYWVFQFVQLIVFLLTAVALAGFFTYVHVQSYQQMKHTTSNDKNINALNSQTLTVGNQKIESHNEGTIHTDISIQTKSNVHETIVALPAKAVATCSFSALIPMILPSVIALIVIFSITRSIVLARQLIASLRLTLSLLTLSSATHAARRSARTPRLLPLPRSPSLPLRTSTSCPRPTLSPSMSSTLASLCRFTSTSSARPPSKRVIVTVCNSP